MTHVHVHPQRDSIQRASILSSTDETRRDSQKQKNNKINDGTNVNKEIIQEALHEGPEEDGFFGAVNWSRREHKKQMAFNYLRGLMKFDVLLSTLAILCLIYTIESENMFGMRFYSISSLSTIFLTSTKQTQMLETPVYENIRPVCWKTMYENGYLAKVQYQSMVYRLVDEFDEYNETSKTRMISNNALTELTYDWESVYKMGSENQNSLPVNSGKFQFYNVKLVKYFRLFISFITIVHIILRCKYYIARFELHSSHMLFLETTLFEEFMTKWWKDILMLIIHLPPLEFMGWSLPETHKLYLQFIVFLRIFYSTIKLSENQGRAQLIEFSMKESLALDRTGKGIFRNFISNRRQTSLLLVDSILMMFASAYWLFSLERAAGSCLTFTECLWVIFSACTNLGMLTDGTMPTTPLGQFVIVFWSMAGVVFWAMIIELIIRLRQLEPESKKVVAVYEQKRCRAILRDMASSLIQASWKMHKNRQYLEYHRKHQTEETESSVSVHEQNCLYQEHIESSFKNKVWLWKKIKREIKLMEAALQKEIINEHVGQTLEEYSSKVKKLEGLSKKACFVMPYPADAHDWDAFWEQLGKPEEKAPTVNKFKKIGWSMIGISGAIKNKPKPMKRLPSRRMSTAGFRQLQNRASRLSLSQESFVKQNKKLHKNKKIRNQIKPKFDTIKEDTMQTLTEDAEMEELAGRITQKTNSIIQNSVNKENNNNNQKQQHQAEENNSQQNKRDSNLIQRVESHASHANNNAEKKQQQSLKNDELEKVQQLLKTVQEMLEKNK